MNLIPLISAIFVLFLGIFVLLKNRASSQNIIFALFCIVTFIWLFGTFMMFRALNDKEAIFWDRFVYIGVVFIPSFLYHFSLVFTNFPNKKRLLKASYLFSFIFLFLSRSTYFVDGLFRYKWGCHTVAQPLHHIFLLGFWIIFSISTYNIYHFCRICKNQIKKRQASYVLIAFIILFIVGAFAYIPAYKISIYSFPFLGGLFFVMIMAYAIIAHRVLDINIIIRKGLVYSLLIALLFIISVVSLFIISQGFSKLIHKETIWPSVPLLITLSIIFQPLYRWSTSLVDKLFFKNTLPKLAEELERSEKLAALGVMASGLAHEIKNPLVPIKTYIQNLPSNINNQEYLSKITKVIPKEVDKINDLLIQLRDFANPPELKLVDVDIHNLLDNRLSFLKEEFANKNIIIKKQYSPSLPKIKADPIQLEKVFLNLFLNAIDAMPNGGTLTVLTKTNGNGNLMIEVSDTGKGIAKEDLPHIFDPFYSKGKQKGTGLGLAICYQIIKQHGGNISVKSNINTGAIFYCTFNI